jgi:hypothetical protein
VGFCVGVTVGFSMGISVGFLDGDFVGDMLWKQHTVLMRHKLKSGSVQCIMSPPQVVLSCLGRGSKSPERGSTLTPVAEIRVLVVGVIHYFILA